MPLTPQKSVACPFWEILSAAFLCNIALASPPSTVNAALADLQAHLAGVIQLIDDLDSAHCLADEELTRKLWHFRETALEYKKGSQAEVSLLTNFLEKPMEGNGRCDGGFQSVAKESRTRAGRTASTKEQLAPLLSAFQSAAAEVARIKAFHALRPGCSERIRKVIDQLTLDSRKAKLSGAALAAALEVTRENLQGYVESNQQLSTHCASNETVLLKAAHEQRRPAALLRSALQKKSESTITGAILPVVK